MADLKKLVMALDALAAEASPRPWKITHPNRVVIDMGRPPRAPFAVCHSDDGSGRDNAAFMLALVEAWPTIRAAIISSSRANGDRDA